MSTATVRLLSQRFLEAGGYLEADADVTFVEALWGTATARRYQELEDPPPLPGMTPTKGLREPGTRTEPLRARPAPTPEPELEVEDDVAAGDDVDEVAGPSARVDACDVLDSTTVARIQDTDWQVRLLIERARDRQVGDLVYRYALARSIQTIRPMLDEPRPAWAVLAARIGMEAGAAVFDSIAHLSDTGANDTHSKELACASWTPPSSWRR